MRTNICVFDFVVTLQVLQLDSQLKITVTFRETEDHVCFFSNYYLTKQLLVTSTTNWKHFALTQEWQTTDSKTTEGYLPFMGGMN